MGGGVQWIPTVHGIARQPERHLDVRRDQLFNPADPDLRHRHADRRRRSSPRRCRRTTRSRTEPHLRGVRAGHVEAAREPDLEPRPALRPADQGLERRVRPVPVSAAAALRGLRVARGQQQPRAAARARMGSAQRRPLGRARRLRRHLHQRAAQPRRRRRQRVPAETITIRNPKYPDPYQGKDPLSFVSTAPPNITIGANNLVNAPAQTFNGGISQRARRRRGAARRRRSTRASTISRPTCRSTSRIRSPGWCRCLTGAGLHRRSRLAPIATGRCSARFEKRVRAAAPCTPSRTRCRSRTAQTTVTDYFNPGARSGAGGHRSPARPDRQRLDRCFPAT